MEGYRSGNVVIYWKSYSDNNFNYFTFCRISSITKKLYNFDNDWAVLQKKINTIKNLLYISMINFTYDGNKKIFLRIFWIESVRSK